MDIKHKRIVLTGAASGIGRALLHLLAEYPVQILAVDVNEAGLNATLREISTKPAAVTPFACDLSSLENVDGLFDQATQIFGSIDIFFANAGFAYFEQIEKADWEHIENIYRVNVFNTLYSIEKMQALHRDDPYKMVVTASAMAYIAIPGYSIYSSTKAALHRFVEGYRWQMKDPRKLMLVYPIATQTGFFNAAGKGVPAAWPRQKAETVARAILKGVQRDRMTVHPSRLFQIVLFLDRFLPIGWLEQWIEQQRLKKWLRMKDITPE